MVELYIIHSRTISTTHIIFQVSSFKSDRGKYNMQTLCGRYFDRQLKVLMPLESITVSLYDRLCSICRERFENGQTVSRKEMLNHLKIKDNHISNGQLKVIYEASLNASNGSGDL